MLKTKEAHDFYTKHIYSAGLQRLLRGHDLNIAGSVPPVIWELFGAILTGDKGKKGYGSDLKGHEIKSAHDGGGFEYQYHLLGGQKKLTEDMSVRHLFISYSPDYKDVVIRLLPGETLKAKFEAWLPKLVKNYKGSKRMQRFRKSISFGYVKKNGIKVMEIKDGKIIPLS